MPQEAPLVGHTFRSPVAVRTACEGEEPLPGGARTPPKVVVAPPGPVDRETGGSSPHSGLEERYHDGRPQ
jgi:hypothetical protein